MNERFARLFFGLAGVGGGLGATKIKGEEGKREEEINEANNPLFASYPFSFK